MIEWNQWRTQYEDSQIQQDSAVQDINCSGFAAGSQK